MTTCARCGQEAPSWAHDFTAGREEPMHLTCRGRITELLDAITVIESLYHHDDSTPVPVLNRLREEAARRAPKEPADMRRVLEYRADLQRLLDEVDRLRAALRESALCFPHQISGLELDEECILDAEFADDRKRCGIARDALTSPRP